MEDLSPREASIIEMRFGLADGNQMTLEEIGKHFRVTRERIRQVSKNLIGQDFYSMEARSKRSCYEALCHDIQYILSDFCVHIFSDFLHVITFPSSHLRFPPLCLSVSSSVIFTLPCLLACTV